MKWDLGLEGLAVLGAMALGFGLFAGLVVGDGWTRRLWAVVTTTVACFGIGLLVSEGLFGWATEEELQPNIDGLSRDEALLSSVLTTVLVVVLMRHFGKQSSPEGRHLFRREHRHHAGHA